MAKHTITLTVTTPDDAPFPKIFEDRYLADRFVGIIHDVLEGKPQFGGWELHQWVIDQGTDPDDQDDYEDHEMYGYIPNYTVSHPILTTEP